MINASNYKNRKYEVVSYDPAWVDKFANEARILHSLFTDETISIEHIGSTSVPGLAGKPIIDILIIVEDISIADQLKEKMEIAGYNALGEYVTEGARLFVRESGDARKYNIHVFQKNNYHVKEMLQLRNYFRTHQDAVREYSELKFDLAKKYPNDYEQYRKFKYEWMEKLKEKIKTSLPT